MSTIRIRAKAEHDGELRLRGLPLRKGEVADVVVFVDASPIDNLLLAALNEDPGWAWLKDPAEDVYTEADVR